MTLRIWQGLLRREQAGSREHTGALPECLRRCAGAGATRAYPKQAAGTGAFENPNAGTILLQNKIVNQIAEKLGKSAGQILIRWSVQTGHVCIPKSSRAERIKQNADVLDWVSATCQAAA